MNSLTRRALYAVSPSNVVLSSLNPSDAARLADAARVRSLRGGEQLFAPGQLVDRAVFPSTATLATVSVMRDGREAETGVIGSEGAFGLTCAFGPFATGERVLARFAGEVLEVQAEILTQVIGASADFRRLLIEHLQRALLSVSAASACRCLHSARQRLCRTLLEAQDRLGQDELPLTQEALSTMLGVQRTTVTMLAGALKDRGWLAYRHGRIRIIDRKALRQAACECYGGQGEHRGD